MKALIGVSVIVIPFSVAIFIFPKEIIQIVLGPNWIEAATVLRVLAIYGALKAISNTVFAVFLSLGKQNYVTLITFIGILGLGVSIFPLVHSFGILGAGISALIGAIATIPASFYLLRKSLMETK